MRIVNLTDRPIHIIHSDHMMRDWGQDVWVTNVQWTPEMALHTFPPVPNAFSEVPAIDLGDIPVIPQVRTATVLPLPEDGTYYIVPFGSIRPEGRTDLLTRGEPVYADAYDYQESIVPVGYNGLSPL